MFSGHEINTGPLKSEVKEDVYGGVQRDFQQLKSVSVFRNLNIPNPSPNHNLNGYTFFSHFSHGLCQKTQYFIYIIFVLASAECHHEVTLSRIRYV